MGGIRSRQIAGGKGGRGEKQSTIMSGKIKMRVVDFISVQRVWVHVLKPRRAGRASNEERPRWRRRSMEGVLCVVLDVNLAVVDCGGCYG